MENTETKELKTHQQILTLYEASLIHYGEDRVMYELPNKDEDETNYKLTIHYPNITITDSRGNYTHIFDLYVRLELDFESGGINYIRGTTLTRTHNQYNNRYRHSHIPGCNSINFDGFCLGTTDISKLKTLSFGEESWDIDECLLFYESLDRYLTQEGSPYMKLVNIGSSTSNHVQSIDFNRYFNSFYLDTKENIRDYIIINTSIDKKTNKFIRNINITDKLIEDFEFYCLENGTKETLLSENIIGVYDSVLGYGMTSNEIKSTTTIVMKDKAFNWKGETRYLTIVPNTYPNFTEVEQEEDNKDYSLTKSALNLLKERYNDKMKNAFMTISNKY